MLPPFPHYLVSVTLFDFCLAFPYLFNGNFIASLPTPVGPLYLPNCKLFIPSVQRFPLPKQLNYHVFLVVMSSPLTAASFLPDADSAGCGTVQHVEQ